MSASSSPKPSILSPTLDLLFVGGLSLIVLVPMLLSGARDLVLVGAGVQAWIATLINMPHFMASYRIVYRDRAMIMKHKWASIYVPLILAVYSAIAVWQAQESQALVIVLITVSSAYLAWHYTGQVWCMMASFGHLEGKGFDKTERLLIRTGLRILLVWHLVWFLYTQLKDPSRVRPFYLAVTFATLVAFGLGMAGLVRLRRRTGQTPATRAVVAWIAIFVWYAAMARDPKALFWVQIAHAVQYLAFPIRVEMNRAAPSAGRFGLHMIGYGVGLVLVSLLVAQVVPVALMGAVGRVFGEEPGKAAPVLILMFINIHHYFTDGVIWKISNPEVRRELFSHVSPASREARP